jgi:DUF4097 and DUF4098 domain-containing protein YvlB
VSAVNGRITIDKGSNVSAGVSNVNGQIELEGAVVGGNLETVNGDVSLEDKSVVKPSMVTSASKTSLS